jgi:hypothetical protein
MKNAILMTNVSQINLVNKYQKGIIFAIGIIVIGGIAHYILYRQYHKLNQRMTAIERSQNKMAGVLDSNSVAMQGIGLGMNQILKENADFFNSLTALGHLLKPVHGVE